MSLEKCLSDGISENTYSKEEVNEVMDLFNQREKIHSKSLSAGAAKSQAYSDTVSAIKADKLHKRRIKLQQAYALSERLADKQKFKDIFGRKNNESFLLTMLSADGRKNISSLRQSIRAYTQLYQRKVADFLVDYKRGVFGTTTKKAEQYDIVREAFGDSTGNKKAFQVWDAFSKVFEQQRLTRNKLGGNTGKIDNWFPVAHNSFSFRKRGEKVWTAKILKHIDYENMVDLKTGLNFTSETIGLALKDMFQSVSTEGWNKINPGGAVRGKTLAKQRMDARFIKWKSGEDFLEYNKMFGVGEPYDIMVGHLQAMSKEIATMKHLGANPRATLEHLKNLHKKEVMMEGKTSEAEVNGFLKKVDGYYGLIDGTLNQPRNVFWGNAFGSLRSILTSAQLGRAFISAISDLNFQRLTRSMNGLRQANTISSTIKYLSPLKGKERAKTAIRMGLIADGITTIASYQQRMLGEVTGHEFSTRIADGVLRASLLNGWTQAGRWAFGMEMLGAFADNATKTFDKLDKHFKTSLTKHGIGSDRWDIIRKTPLMEHEGATFFSIDDLVNRQDIPEQVSEDLAVKILEMIDVETNHAIPSSSDSGRYAIVGETQGGSILGEFVRSVAMYKNFGITLIFTHMMRGFAEAGWKGKASYLGSFFIGATIMGAAALQMKEIASGRDPRDMTDSRFWYAAMLQGGGLGIFGDYFYSATDRYDHPIGKTIVGPVVAFFDDFAHLTGVNAFELATGQETNFGEELVQFAKKYTPGSNIWYYNTALERIVFDQLRLWIDPRDTRKKFKAHRKKKRRETGQHYWWKPGQISPERKPDFEAAIGN